MGRALTSAAPLSKVPERKVVERSRFQRESLAGASPARNANRPRSSVRQSATLRRWRSQVQLLSRTPVSWRKAECPMRRPAMCLVGQSASLHSAFILQLFHQGSGVTSSISPREGDGSGANPDSLTSCAGQVIAGDDVRAASAFVTDHLHVLNHASSGGRKPASRRAIH